MRTVRNQRSCLPLAKGGGWSLRLLDRGPALPPHEEA
jgi:hypothetical protein